MATTNAICPQQGFDEVSAEFDDYLANPGHFHDPYPLFRRVRDVEPLHWSKTGTWVVLGHPEGREVFRHRSLSRQASAEEFAGRARPSDIAAREALDTHLAQFVHMDDPEHARVRTLVSRAFSPKAVLKWESVIVETVDGLIEGLRDRDQFDMLHDFGYPIPSKVICEMVGVPFADHKLFEEWTTDWLNTNLTDPRADVTTAVKPLVNFMEYLRELVHERRRAQGDREDLVTLLINAEQSGDRLSERELIASLMLLIIGGHETTANLISNGTLALMQNPDQLELLRSDPPLVTSATEELLRFATPARSQPRVALEDVAVGDKVIRTGERVQVLASAVNRDGRVFERPDELDITRTNNNHLSFGVGAHFCLGVHVARLEARNAFAALTQRLGPLEVAGDLQWRNGHVRALTGLPVARVK